MSVDFPAPFGPSRPMDAAGERSIQLLQNDALAEADLQPVEFDDGGMGNRLWVVGSRL